MDDILSKVQEILGDPEKLNGFKNLAASLLNNNSDDQPQENKGQENNTENNEPNENFDVEDILKSFLNNNSNNENKASENNKENNDKFNIPLNIDTILKFQNAFSTMNKDDKNISFLKSLKILLGDEKQQKVDNAIKIMRLIKLLPLIKDLNLLKDFKIL